MFYVDPKIYDKTLLEGIPFTLKYCESRPKHGYNINSGRPTLHNFRDWHNLSDNPYMWRLRNLYLHDMSHAVLYFMRDEKYRLFENDFGLNWNNVFVVNPDHHHFAIKSERTDEYKISAIHDILMCAVWRRKPFTFKQIVSKTEYSSRYVWHTKKPLTSIVKKQKHLEVVKATDYVYNEIGPSAVRDAARSFVIYMKEHFE
jgi:hypothetical protein